MRGEVWLPKVSKRSWRTPALSSRREPPKSCDRRSSTKSDSSRRVIPARFTPKFETSSTLARSISPPATIVPRNDVVVRVVRRARRVRDSVDASVTPKGSCGSTKSSRLRASDSVTSYENAPRVCCSGTAICRSLPFWRRCRLGTSALAAAFRLNGTPRSYEVVVRREAIVGAVLERDAELIRA